MKCLAVMNEKGGVGKSMVACQFAFFEALKRSRRVLVIDLDQQKNTSHCLAESGKATVAKVTASDVLMYAHTLSEEERKSPFVLIEGDAGLSGLERHGEQYHNRFVANLYTVLSGLENDFDLCIIDTNPSPDCRAWSALCIATHCVAPVELKREALDGVFELFNKVQGAKEVNPAIEFVGLIPNLVENKPFQKQNMAMLLKNARNAVLFHASGKVAFLANRTAFAEAQSESRPAWEFQKSADKKPWLELREVFLTLDERIMKEARS